MANKKVSQLTSKPSVLTTDLFPIADPSTGQLYKTTISDLGTAIGSGVSSVNSLVGAVVLDTDDIQELVSPTNKWFTDTRARAALSASSPLTYNSGTGAFGIQVANGSQNGYLSSTDWTTFNAKQAALSGTGFVKISGTTISYDNSTYLTTSAAASTYLALAGGELTGALLGTSAAFSGYVGIGNSSPLYNLDVTGSGRFAGDLRIESTNPRIYLTDTDNNPDYFISNTDGTFTVYDVTNSTARFTIGTTGNATFTNAITGGGSITGQSLYSNGIVSVGTYLIMPANNTVGGTNYYIGQQMAGSDYWRIFGNSVSADQGELVFSLGDNGVPIASNGQRFRFYYDASSDGTSKDALIIDYNTSTFTTSLVATGATFTGALSGTSATFSSTITSSRNDTGNISLTLQNSYINQGNLINFQQNKAGSTINAYIGHGGDSTGNFIINNGTQAITITNSGSVGIGTSVISQNFAGYTHLDIGNSVSGGIILFSNGSGTNYGYVNAESGGLNLRATVGVLTFNTGATERMRITSSGNVGIGTTSPNLTATNRTTLDINGTTSSLLGLSVGGTAKAYIYHSGTNFAISNYTNGGNLDFNTYGTDGDSTRMRITSGGNVLIGTTSSLGFAMEVNGSIWAQKLRINDTASGYVTLEMENSSRWRINYLGRFSGYGAGTLTTDASGNISASSDRTLKDVIKPIENVLENIKDFEPVYFKWNDKTDLDKENIYMSTIAQSIQKHYPDAVGKMADGTLTVQDRAVTAILVQAIKELKAELDTLKNK